MREFGDEVIVNSVLCGPQDDHGPRVVNCEQEPQPEAPPVLWAADPAATFGIHLPSPCWQWVLLLTWAPKGASLSPACPSHLTQTICVAPGKVLQVSRVVN